MEAQFTAGCWPGFSPQQGKEPGWWPLVTSRPGSFVTVTGVARSVLEPSIKWMLSANVRVVCKPFPPRPHPPGRTPPPPPPAPPGAPPPRGRATGLSQDQEASGRPVGTGRWEARLGRGLPGERPGGCWGPLQRVGPPQGVCTSTGASRFGSFMFTGSTPRRRVKGRGQHGLRMAAAGRGACPREGCDPAPVPPLAPRLPGTRWPGGPQALGVWQGREGGRCGLGGGRPGPWTVRAGTPWAPDPCQRVSAAHGALPAGIPSHTSIRPQGTQPPLLEPTARLPEGAEGERTLPTTRTGRGSGPASLGSPAQVAGTAPRHGGAGFPAGVLRHQRTRLLSSSRANTTARGGALQVRDGSPPAWGWDWATPAFPAPRGSRPARTTFTPSEASRSPGTPRVGPLAQDRPPTDPGQAGPCGRLPRAPTVSLDPLPCPGCRALSWR